jgi:hypothetical protein
MKFLLYRAIPTTVPSEWYKVTIVDTAIDDGIYYKALDGHVYSDGYCYLGPKSNFGIIEAVVVTPRSLQKYYPMIETRGIVNSDTAYNLVDRLNKQTEK